MSHTKGVGPFFLQHIRIKRGTSFVHRALTYEIEEPYRFSRSVVVHMWPGHGLVIGWWKRTGWTEEEALRAATQAEYIDPLDTGGHLLPEYHRQSQPQP